MGRQQAQCRRPVVPRARQIARSRGNVGPGCELFQRVGMNERRAGGAGQRIRRQFSTAAGAVCRRRRQAGLAAGAAPTRYGPRICNEGAPVILQACLMPMKMMNALMRPEGNDPNTTSTGRAAIKAARSTRDRRTRRPLGFAVAADPFSIAAAVSLWLLV